MPPYCLNTSVLLLMMRCGNSENYVARVAPFLEFFRDKLRSGIDVDDLHVVKCKIWSRLITHDGLFEAIDDLFSVFSVRKESHECV
jgi:hypothetical protein